MGKYLSDSDIRLYRTKWVDNWEKTWKEARIDPDFGREFFDNMCERMVKRIDKRK